MDHDEIRIARLRAGVKQQDMAKRLRITSARLSQFERHGVPLKPRTLERLVKEIQKLKTNV